VGACGLPTVSKVARCRICARRAFIAGERPRRRSVGWPAGDGFGCAIRISIPVLGGLTTAAMPVGPAGHGDGYIWLKMAKTGCDWPRDSSGFPRHGQGGRRAGPTNARLYGRWHGNCPGSRPTSSGPSWTRRGNTPYRDPQPSQRSKGARPMKTETRVRAVIFTTNLHATLVRDKRCRRSSRPIGSVPYPACSGTTSRGRRNI
jgi:hypothetical protein